MLRGLGMSEADAEDAAQEALIALWRCQVPVPKPLGFLRTVGDHELAKLWRARQEGSLVPDVDQCVHSQAANSSRGVDLVCEGLLARLVREALLTLPPRQREILACHYDGYSNDEISKALGLLGVTVRTNLHHAREKLKPLIKAHGRDLYHPHVLHRAYSEMRGGNLYPAGALPEIAKSWQRSKDHGVDADRCPAGSASSPDLAKSQDACPLSAIRQTVGTWLTDVASRYGLIMTISDGTGLVLWRDGDHDLLWRTENDGFCEGHYWIEETAGTNAAGLALHSGYPVVVVTAQHWIAKHHDLVCAAAPVRDPRDGQILGVLNLTGQWPASHKDMLRLIDEAAQQARRQLAHTISERSLPSSRDVATATGTCSIDNVGKTPRTPINM